MSNDVHIHLPSDMTAGEVKDVLRARTRKAGIESRCAHPDAKREYVPVAAFRATCQVCGAVSLHPAVGGPSSCEP